MKRRHFLHTTLAAGFALSARAAEPAQRVAVIGHTGRGNYGHGLDTMWAKVPGVEVVAVADADAKGLAAARLRIKVERGFADYRAMLAEVKPDIVAIAPRFVDEHRDMALAAVAAGARGIYIEKPFCRTPAEADEIVAACDAKKVKLAVAHRNRWHPALPVAVKLIAEGLIGRVLEMRARGKEDARGGGLDAWVLGSHVFNLACVFGGKPVACSATLLTDGRPAVPADLSEGAEGVGLLAGNELHARYEMERGVPLFFDSIKDAGEKTAAFGLQIIGSKGIVDFRIDTEPLVHVLAGSPMKPDAEPRAWRAITSGGVGVAEPIPGLAGQIAGHLTAAQDLLAAIREDRAPLCDAAAGRVTVEMVCAAFESHRLGGKSVRWPLLTRVHPLGVWA